MSYTCFISYNAHPDERVVVYRLQTLASASGISVLLPRREGRALTSETKQRIDDADSVLAFLTSGPTAAVREELAYAQGRGKLIIPIAYRDAKLAGFDNLLHWIRYDPTRDTPGDVEHRVIQLLKEKKKAKENQEAALLAVLGIGLFALLAQRK